MKAEKAIRKRFHKAYRSTGVFSPGLPGGRDPGDVKNPGVSQQIKPDREDPGRT